MYWHIGSYTLPFDIDSKRFFMLITTIRLTTIGLKPVQALAMHLLLPLACADEEALADEVIAAKESGFTSRQIAAARKLATRFVDAAHEFGDDIDSIEIVN
jgi:hypothetical protein